MAGGHGHGGSVCGRDILCSSGPGVADQYRHVTLSHPFPSLWPAACSNVERILADWDGLLPASLAAWGEGEERLAAAFEAHRSALMAGAAERWQALNPLVGGMR